MAKINLDIPDKIIADLEVIDEILRNTDDSDLQSRRLSNSISNLVAYVTADLKKRQSDKWHDQYVAVQEQKANRRK